MELTEQVLDTAKRCQNLECDGCHYCIPGYYEGNGCDFKSFARDAEIIINKLKMEKVKTDGTATDKI